MNPPAEVQPAIAYDRLIDCLQMVEGRAWSSHGGALGWTLAAWHEDAEGRPFRSSQDPAVARHVATRRLIRVGRILQQHGHPPSIRNLAQVWRSGVSGFLSGKPREPGYGERVHNLYYDNRSASSRSPARRD